MLTVGYVEHPLNYRFERNNELSFWTLEYLFAGCVEVQAQIGRQIYPPASVMLIAPTTPYRVRWSDESDETQWKELYVVFDALPNWSTLLSWPLSACGLGIMNLPQSDTREEIEAVFAGLMELRRSTRINGQALLFNAFERALLMLDEINPNRGYARRDDRIERALTYIATHYAEPLELSALAREAYLSPSRFSHLFRAQIGLTPMQYLEQYRLERAAEKLLTGHNSIEQLAQSVGFANPFHFSTRFRRRFGQSPSHYRRNPR